MNNTAGPNRDAEREVIVILGGLPPGEPMTAQGGGVTWTRRKGETLDVFKARVMADSIEASTGFVVFGGLPDGSEADARL